MVNISSGDLKQLHYDSDHLRNIFFDMDCSESEIVFTPKEKLIPIKELEYAKELIIKINKKIIELDVENINEDAEDIEEIPNENYMVNADILDLMQKYYSKYDYIIEYGNRRRITIKKDMILEVYNNTILYYYENNKACLDPNTLPLGAIMMDSITAIKRSE